MYKKILVTGSSAVLGTAIKKLSLDLEKEFIFWTSKDCDLTNIDDTIIKIKKINPDAIIHLAAKSGGIGLSRKFQASMLRDISLMNISVLEAARLNKVKKTIMTLTTGMYPPDAPLPLKEETMHYGDPHESNYGSSFAKRMIDPLIRSYRDEFNLNVIGLIPSGIFGENDNFNLEDAPMLPALIRRSYEAKLSGKKIEVWGDGTPLREYTYSEDLAKIYIWALENYDSEQSINIGTTEENSIKDISYMIGNLMNINPENYFFNTKKKNGVFRKNIDNTKFIKLNNFKYTPFKIGLEKTIKWFIENYNSADNKIRLQKKI